MWVATLLLTLLALLLPELQGARTVRFRKISESWKTVEPEWPIHRKEWIYDSKVEYKNNSFFQGLDQLRSIPDHCSSTSPDRQLVVPDRFHMILILEQHAARNPITFGFTHYLAIKSVLKNAHPEDGMYVHYTYEPTGPWWALVKHLVKHVKVPFRETYFGHHIRALEHRSDIVRLQVLEEYGGVYIDHDTLVLRSLKPLYHQDFVLGREGAKSYLNNGIIVSRPKAPFAMRLVSQYAGYNTSSWTQNSVEAGMRLAHEYPKDVCALPPYSYYWPLWSQPHMDILFGEKSKSEVEAAVQWIQDVDGQKKPVLNGRSHYAQHYWWRAATWFFCVDVKLPNITYIRTVDTVMNHFLRRVFDDVQEGDWPAPSTRPCTNGVGWWWEQGTKS